MTSRKAMTDKILLLGVDGLDPRLTRKFVDGGKMPNVKKYLERGAAREDLTMLGGHPTVTPPMWTTLSTGCYANVHGITGFFRKSATENLDVVEYNLDSRLSKAEPLWNVFAEAGKNTLVWHWPGCAWPPTSESEHLYVVDGSSPGSVGMAVMQVETEFLLGASAEFTDVIFRPQGACDAAAPCVINDLNVDYEFGDALAKSSQKQIKTLFLEKSQQTLSIANAPVDLVQSPIREAKGWSAAPQGAKEFTMLLSSGMTRRPCLILPDAQGDYTQVAIYKSKKETAPIAVLEKGVIKTQIRDIGLKGDKVYQCIRNMKLLSLDRDGSRLSMWVSAAMDIEDDSVFHPKRIYQNLVEQVGFVPPTSMMGAQDQTLITDCMLDNWYQTADWQARAIKYCIQKENIEVVFSHFHAPDLQGHMFIQFLADKGENKLPMAAYEKFVEDVYVQADYYLGQFVDLLDEGWTILIFSDHALVASRYRMPFLGENSGVNVRIMQELGFTVLKTDAEGHELPEIDWSKTRAIAQRENHIYINLKGRDPQGIVDPADQYELEEDIMTALYSYRYPESGKRCVALALRNKDAVLLGLGGPESGDICYWVAEGYNFDHGESLSTTIGSGDTSVSPIFIAAGRGIKQGYSTQRIIRQIDFAATVAALGGVRMPANCEGAPAYQIFAEEF